MPRAAELAAHEDLDESMVLLIDDVDDPGAELLVLRELLAKRQAADKQTVLTSRAYPKTLVDLEEFVRMRCEWGLICDIMSMDADLVAGIEHLRQQGR